MIRCFFPFLSRKSHFLAFRWKRIYNYNRRRNFVFFPNQKIPTLLLQERTNFEQSVLDRFSNGSKRFSGIGRKRSTKAEAILRARIHLLLFARVAIGAWIVEERGRRGLENVLSPILLAQDKKRKKEGWEEGGSSSLLRDIPAIPPFAPLFEASRVRPALLLVNRKKRREKGQRGWWGR